MTSSRRACLVVPGSSAHMLEKARAAAVDEVVVDLEDAVLPEHKDEARARVVAALAEPGWACGTIAVRVNAPGSPWCHEDLIALAGAGGALNSVVVPKVDGPGDLAFVDALLSAAPLAVQALIESPRGLQQVAAVAGAPRVAALILGYADLAAALGTAVDASRDPRTWLPAQHAVLWAARAAGVQAIDGPWLGTAVDAPFTASVRHAAGLGFDGKWAIHPGQIAAVTDAFTPDPGQVDWARSVLAAIDDADAGAVALDGQMVDEAVGAAARRILKRAAVLG
jgi:citrate lyase subunit beta/citryl-CoA lyase